MTGIEQLLENRLLEISTDATITDVNDTKVVSIDTKIRDWNTLDKYPAVVVIYDKWTPAQEEISGIIKEHILWVGVLTMAEEEEDAKDMRAVIVSRLETAFRKSQQLQNLVDNVSNEKALFLYIDSCDYMEAGFKGAYQAAAQFRLRVITERLGPFI